MNSSTKNIHIVMILGWYYPDSVGGTENYVRLLSRDLNTLGYRVTILAPSVNEKEACYRYEEVNVYRYPISLTPDIKEIRGEIQPQYFAYFTNKIKELNPDIVHMHSATRACSVYHAEFIKSENIPLVLTTHVPDFVCARGTLMKWGNTVCSGIMDIKECTACASEMHGLPKILSYGLSYVPKVVSQTSGISQNKVSTAFNLKEIISTRIQNSKTLFSLSDKIVSVSKWYQEILRRNGISDEKIIYSAHGLKEQENVNKDCQDSNEETLKIGYIGRFKEVKGVHILIKAIKKLPKSLTVKVLLYGRADTEEENQYLKILRDLSKDEPRIEFAGEVNDRNRSTVFSSIDILAIPSIWLETGPYVLLEAFSEKTPVLGSNLGGISELITNGVNGKLVEPENLDSWAEKIKELCINRQLINKYKDRIGPVKKSIDVAKEMSAIYKDILTTNAI